MVEDLGKPNNALIVHLYRDLHRHREYCELFAVFFTRMLSLMCRSLGMRALLKRKRSGASRPHVLLPCLFGKGLESFMHSGTDGDQFEEALARSPFS
ncbi:hypothetical protein HDA36_004675 [Nocardiopsis composta]|uniref:Uncharacterized protein n=1 Tax=Nocardiopsis composta TaxID=157465 RepID=A0A7W8VFI5_9ACTN|nr:hypothetical protein [Nocardiopsis composta]